MKIRDKLLIKTIRILRIKRMKKIKEIKTKTENEIEKVKDDYLENIIL